MLGRQMTVLRALGTELTAGNTPSGQQLYLSAQPVMSVSSAACSCPAFFSFKFCVNHFASFQLEMMENPKISR